MISIGVRRSSGGALHRGGAEQRVLSIVPPSLPTSFSSRTVELTEYPVVVTAAGAQDLRLALDVLDFDELDLELRVLERDAVTFEVELQTGMQRQSTDGWITYPDEWRPLTGNSTESKNFKNMLRYVRWNVLTLVGGRHTATFLIRGIGRRWSQR